MSIEQRHKLWQRVNIKSDTQQRLKKRLTKTQAQVSDLQQYATKSWFMFLSFLFNLSFDSFLGIWYLKIIYIYRKIKKAIKNCFAPRPLVFFVTPPRIFQSTPVCTLILVWPIPPPSQFFNHPLLEIVATDISKLTTYLPQTIYLSITKKAHMFKTTSPKKHNLNPPSETKVNREFFRLSKYVERRSILFGLNPESQE